MAKITYQEGMEILKSMFEGLDEETLKSVLVMNKGKLEPTIESLLKLSGDGNEYEQERSMFGQENNEFQEDPFALNSLSKKQEDEDRKLAYMLQKEYIAQARQEQEEMKYEDNVQHHSKKKKHKPRPEQIENQLDEPQQLENIGNEQEDDLQPNFQPFKKEKKSFKDQIKSAKERFMSMFKKKKKNGLSNSGNKNEPKEQELIAFEEEDNDVVLLPSSNNNIEGNHQPQFNKK